MKSVQSRQQPLSNLLLEREETPFVILDGAAVADLPQLLYTHEPPHRCLYRGELTPDLAETAPYLIQLESGASFTDWLLPRMAGESWGVFVLGSDLRTLHRHFRRFLIVHDESGKPLYFRYYDPRVLRVFLPTCTAQELREFFGPVHAFVMDGGMGKMFVEYKLNGDVLAGKEHPMGE